MLAWSLLPLISGASFSTHFGVERALCCEPRADGAILLAALGLCADVLAVILPSVGSRLWSRCQWAGSGMAWAIWQGAVTMTLLVASGGASQNLGDAIAGRAAIAERGGRLRKRLSGCRGGVRPRPGRAHGCP
jgi:hypothetical protein